MKCDICGSMATYVKKHTHDYLIKGQIVKFDSDRRFCKECNNLVYDSELDNLASQKAIELYNEKYGITKEEILGLRLQYDLSQELFAKIIGCAKKTLISYEKGTSIPNDNYYIILNSLLANKELIVPIIMANKSRFNDKEYSRLKENLFSKLNNNLNGIHSNSDLVLSEFNGYTAVNKKKVLHTILYFAQKGILKTKLLKEMFYADFLSYKKYGCSITGLEYVKLPFGPVPDGFEKIIGDFTEKNMIDYKRSFSSNSEYEYHEIKSRVKFDKNIFSNDELKVLETVREYFKDFNSKQIADFSHNEKAFVEPKFNNYISYDYAFELANLNENEDIK